MYPGYSVYLAWRAVHLLIPRRRKMALSLASPQPDLFDPMSVRSRMFSYSPFPYRTTSL